MSGFKFDTMTIEDLQKKNCTFWIPDFQRGYRWKEQQITELLNDVNDFAKKVIVEGAKNAGFYCLQPIMLKEKDAGIYEVIDGQQRLTSIFLILKYLIEKHNDDRIHSFKLDYQTRGSSANKRGSAEFLEDIHTATEKEALLNIDHYHMFAGYRAISKFLGSLSKDDRNDFSSKFKKNVKIIWYEMPTDTNISSHEQFQNINARRIPLTNAELIKALLLSLNNFKRNPDDKEGNKDEQFYWGTQWDSIEKELHNEDFWFFLTSETASKKMETRIDLVFDVVAQSYQQKFSQVAKYKKKNTQNFSFKILYELWNESDDKVKFAKDTLKRMKQVYQSFLEWYENDDFFHYVGFITCFPEADPDAIQKIYNAQQGKTKKQIKTWLVNEIIKLIGINDVADIEALSYGSIYTKRVLLLFNICSLSKGVRFSFKEYKLRADGSKSGWDLEHIHSQHDKIKHPSDRVQWLKMFIDTCDGMGGDLSGLVSQAKNMIANDTWSSYEALEDAIINAFSDADNDNGGDSIANIAILNSDINQSYKNAIFPKKRVEIIKREKSGVFIPVATKNVFLKFYSGDHGDLSKMFMWTKNDRKAYLEEIKVKIGDFLKKSRGEAKWAMKNN